MKNMPFGRSAILALLLCCALPAMADEGFLRFGLHTVDPTSDNGRLADGTLNAQIGSDTRPTIVLGRFLDEHWALELLAAAPFEHAVRLNGAGAVNFKHLPPTLSLQYYFGESGSFRPFVGAGLNYTWTYDEKTRGPVAGSLVGIANSWGLAAQLGAVVPLGKNWELVADLRWIDIDANVKLNGARVGSVAVDPLVYGLYVGFRFF